MDPSKPVDDWPLQRLADKLAQYCPLAEWRADDLRPYCRDYETLRSHLRQRGEDAYWQRVSLLACSNAPAACAFHEQLQWKDPVAAAVCCK